MKQLSTIAIKLSLFIIAAAGIVAACSMNCGCCDPGKVQKAETAACCTDQVSKMSLVPLVSGMLDEPAQDMQDACNSCNCNTLPQNESNAVTSGNLSLKLHIIPVSVLSRSFVAPHNYIHKTSIVSINALSVPAVPLRI
jgi:hypothetical protein